MKLNLTILSLSLLCACTDQPQFQHEIEQGPVPWTHERFDDSPEKFTFALFSDLTGGERPRIFEVAVAQLNLLRPDMIVNVGDLIDGTGDAAEWNRQWNDFDERADKAKAPIFYAGGNHDLTGEQARSIWKERLGQRYYHFVYRNVLFMVMDTEDNSIERMAEIEKARNEAIVIYDSQGPEAFTKTAYAAMPERRFGNIGEEQAAYMRQAIKDNPEVQWTFLMMHKPVWEKEGEENFLSIENALTDRAYTVFNGHTHRYKHEERRGHDYINLATTGGEQFIGDFRSADHITLVTVDASGVDIANILLEGILDKTGKIPAAGDTLCFELANCIDEPPTN